MERRGREKVVRTSGNFNIGQWHQSVMHSLLCHLLKLALALASVSGVKIPGIQDHSPPVKILLTLTGDSDKIFPLWSVTLKWKGPGALQCPPWGSSQSPRLLSDQ